TGCPAGCRRRRPPQCAAAGSDSSGHDLQTRAGAPRQDLQPCAGQCGETGAWALLSLVVSFFPATHLLLSSPRRRGPITPSISVLHWLCHIAWTRRMGPRLRAACAGTTTESDATPRHTTNVFIR